MTQKITQNLRLTDAPSVEPITLAEARDHLRLVASGSPATHPDDDIIEAFITAARQHIDGKDGWLGRCLITQTWELVLDTFPDGEIRLPLSPVQEVVAIYYDDENGVEQTVAPGDYMVDTASEPGWVVPVSGVSWPTTLDGINTVRVQFKAGYGDAADDVPGPIKSAIKLILAHLYSNREPMAIEGTAVETLLTPFVVWTF
jgi:uncharacterized phiE125 gp8 family phage protein